MTNARGGAVLVVQRVAQVALWLVLSAVVTSATLAQSQQPTRTAPQAPAPAAGYNYDPAGRRDPFVSLVNRGVDLRGPSTRPEGLAGLQIDELTVKGIILSRGAYVAILQGPDDKTHVARNGDKLFDGVVKAVTPDAVVFVQQVTDPLSLVKQREVRKPLRPVEEGK